MDEETDTITYNGITHNSNVVCNYCYDRHGSIHTFLHVDFNVAVHQPEAGIQRAESDDDVSLGRHCDNVLDRRVPQVQDRKYSVAPVRMRTVFVVAHDVAVVFHPSSRRHVLERVAHSDDGEAVAVHVDRMVGEGRARAEVEQDELYGAVVRQLEHVRAVTSVATILRRARSAVIDVVLQRQRKTLSLRVRVTNSSDILLFRRICIVGIPLMVVCRIDKFNLWPIVIPSYIFV